ncbi:carboxylate-amine ligase [Actinokineospora sp. HUAS TT18]|uniref:carboxylate-amine ligase n=1 Tax=Actinokineospora sp. HUAS TT18 TaxID=3447451 RepID=UPI003F51F32C
MQDGSTVGVEEEFFLVDPSGQLVTRAPEALAGADRHVDVKPEMMRCQVESATGVCRTADDLKRELTDLRATLREGARALGARLMASGTVPHTQHGLPIVGPGSRYQRIAEAVGPIVFGGTTCGCHVHVGVADRADAVRVCNWLRPWLPTLLALSANSPFFDGVDTGYASTRHLLWGRWPCAGPTPYLESVDHYEELVTGLLATGAALDRKMVYWDVRPSEHQPTVEVRVPDVQVTADDAVLLAVLVRAIVVRALDNLSTPAPRVPTELIRAGLWRAARDGLDGTTADPVTGEQRPVRAVVADLMRTVPDLESTVELTTGATRQRAAYARRQRLSDVLDVIA